MNGPGPRSFGVVIPARYASTRFPGKPLVDIAGKPMVVRVLELAERAGAAFSIVATDDERIAEVVTLAGGDVMLTSPDCATGTDRLAEVARRSDISDTQACGAGGLNGLMEAARHKSLQVHLLERQTSGDTAGDNSRVVGYGAFALFEPD